MAALLQKKVKAAKFVQRVKHGQNELLIPTPLHMPIWRPANIVKIPTMLKKLKAAKGKAANGQVTRLAGSRLGSH
ncbi:MAG: hypothetical protein CME98_01695 [Hyphomonas sp.]|nr:hypothetical protein [Hyphomonas sp.]